MADEDELRAKNLLDPPILSDVIESVPACVAHEYRVVPVAVGIRCTLATADLLTDLDAKSLAFLCKRPIATVRVSREHLEAAIKHYYPDELDYSVTFLDGRGERHSSETSTGLAEMAIERELDLFVPPISSDVLEFVPAPLAHLCQVLPVAVDEDRVTIVAGRPLQEESCWELESLLGISICVIQFPREEFEVALDHYYPELGKVAAPIPMPMPLICETTTHGDPGRYRRQAWDLLRMLCRQEEITAFRMKVLPDYSEVCVRHAGHLERLDRFTDDVGAVMNWLKSMAELEPSIVERQVSLIQPTVDEQRVPVLVAARQEGYLEVLTAKLMGDRCYWSWMRWLRPGSTDLLTPTIPKDVISTVTGLMAHVYQALPVAFREGQLTVVSGRPFRQSVSDELEAFLGLSIRIVTIPEDRFRVALEHYYPTAELHGLTDSSGCIHD